MPKVRVSTLQRKHFGSMAAHELEAVIRDAYKQMDVIAFSPTQAGEYKRNELQLRVDYCKQLLRSKK